MAFNESFCGHRRLRLRTDFWTGTKFESLEFGSDENSEKPTEQPFPLFRPEVD